MLSKFINNAQFINHDKILQHVYQHVKSNPCLYVFVIDLTRSLKDFEHPNGVFTLAGSEADTETDKKWVVQNCVEVVILTSTQIPIRELCYQCLSVSFSVSVSVSGSVNAP